MSSKPLNLPGKHLINASLLGANAVTMAGFLSMGVGTPLVAASYLGASTLLSFIKGFTTTAAIGGDDMRAYSLMSDRADVLRPPLSGRYHGAQCLLVRQTVHVLYMKSSQDIFRGFALVAEGKQDKCHRGYNDNNDRFQALCLIIHFW